MRNIEETGLVSWDLPHTGIALAGRRTDAFSTVAEHRSRMLILEHRANVSTYDVAYVIRGEHKSHTLFMSLREYQADKCLSRSRQKPIKLNRNYLVIPLNNFYKGSNSHLYLI